MASKPTKTELETKLVKLKKLIKKNTEHGEHANKISNILLWLAINHPQLLKKNTKELKNVSVQRLQFPKSWRLVDELVPTEALITLLKSNVCKDLQSFCGYVNTQVLKHFPHDVFTVRLAMGNLIDNGALLEELRCRRERQHNYMENNPDRADAMPSDGSIIIHLRCGKIKLEDLSPLPDFSPQVYISDVSDDDTAWVIQAITKLRPNFDDPLTQDPDLEALYLPQSKLTMAGVEAIAKGLFEANVGCGDFKISSCNINASTDYSDEGSDEDSDEDSDGESEKFCSMISKKYFNQDFTTVAFTDDREMDFTYFKEFISSDLTDSLLVQLANAKESDADYESKLLALMKHL